MRMLKLLLAIAVLVFSADVRPVAQPAVATGPSANASGLDVRLPLKKGSIRWAVIGDNGTGQAPEAKIGELMQQYWAVVHFDFVTMDGDNIYGGHSPEDFKRKFESPYKPLLDENVKFYASLGNHDDADIEKNYKLYNMGGNRYYTFRKGDVQFFVLDSNYMDPVQLAWIEDKLKNSDAKWKIAYFHHPLFTSAKYHGPDVDLRQQ